MLTTCVGHVVNIADAATFQGTYLSSVAHRLKRSQNTYECERDGNNTSKPFVNDNECACEQERMCASMDGVTKLSRGFSERKRGEESKREPETRMKTKPFRVERKYRNPWYITNRDCPRAPRSNERVTVCDLFC